MIYKFRFFIFEEIFLVGANKKRCSQGLCLHFKDTLQFSGPRGPLGMILDQAQLFDFNGHFRQGHTHTKELLKSGYLSNTTGIILFNGNQSSIHIFPFYPIAKVKGRMEISLEGTELYSIGTVDHNTYV